MGTNFLFTNQDGKVELYKQGEHCVTMLAKRYQGQGLTLQQLEEEGKKGLEEAAKRFDETAGYSFMSYAVWWIRQRILQALSRFSGGERQAEHEELTGRERCILQSIDEGVPLSEIASQWGLTERRLAQIRARALKKSNKKTDKE